ncbi:mechanosensitive ion channel family protein [Salimicrobium halophilum]|uniref:Small conductance mechanosensitive channel n=1 Tax=Salimicrobium halophilum TaxID=86666 RepID=A0A1G8RR27_9BACI|nr:mechanosensitive ion channel family protein [Salimicrobium halophilum]SDJ18810.1 small conductance mechanosensitive channel [Salimicrobium halophilum]
MEIFGLEFNLSEIVSAIVPVLLQVLLLLIAFAIIKPIGSKAITKMIETMGAKKNLSPGRTKTLEKLCINVFSYALLFILIVMLLGTVNIDIGPLLAGAGIIGLAIAFGAQNLVADVVTGFFLLLERQVEVDDYVTVGGYGGIVEEVGIRTTKVRGFDGTLHFVPNRLIEGVSNHSRGNMRALVDIGISYDDSIDEAMKVLQEVADRFKEDERFKEGPDVLGVQSIGSSDIVIRILGQTKNMEQWAVERDMRKAIKEALDEAGIDIPFPHQVNLYKGEAKETV